MTTRTSTSSSTRKKTRSRSQNTNGASFSAQVETIGPVKAQQYLDLMGRNRKKRGRLKQRFTDAMAAGHWKLTGEAIKFNTRGELIDGQHRLEAIIESGKSVQILVCRNVPDEAFMELDTGGTRTPGDLLTVAGYDYTNGVASAIRNITSIYEIEAQQIRPSSIARKRVEPEVLLEYAEEHSEGLVTAVKKTMTKQARTVCGPPALFAALYYIFAEHNKKAADQFFDTLIDGIGPEGQGFELGRQDPIYQLNLFASPVQDGEAQATSGILQGGHHHQGMERFPEPRHHLGSSLQRERDVARDQPSQVTDARRHRQDAR